jgi:hypothetical protein
MGWIHLVVQDGNQCRGHVNIAMNLWIPQKVGNFPTKRMTISFSTRTASW